MIRDEVMRILQEVREVIGGDDSYEEEEIAASSYHAGKSAQDYLTAYTSGDSTSNSKIKVL
jgi:hypothetical protein